MEHRCKFHEDNTLEMLKEGVSGDLSGGHARSLQDRNRVASGERDGQGHLMNVQTVQGAVQKKLAAKKLAAKKLAENLKESAKGTRGIGAFYSPKRQ